MRLTRPGSRAGWAAPGSRGGLALLACLPIVLSACGGSDPPPSRELLDLVDGLESARIRPETTRLDLGSEAARAHLVSGFQERREPVDVLRSRGRSVVVAVDVALPRDTTLRVRARARGAAVTPVEVALDGLPVGSMSLHGRFDVHELEIPGRLWEAGERRLRFRVPTGSPLPEVIDWDWIELQRASEFPDSSPVVRRDASRQPTLRIPYGTRLEFAARLPDGARLRLGSVAAAGTAGRLRVRVLTDGESGLRELARQRHRIGSGDISVDMPLPRGDDGIVRIALRARPGPADGEGRVAEGAVLLKDARIVAPATARRPTTADAPTAPETASGPPAPPSAGAPPSIILFLVDTLRADRLGAYGYERPTSPRLDRLAAERGVLFERALAHSSWTKPTVASVFTGLHPPTHGVVEHERLLDDDLETMAELLSSAGYETAGFITITTVASIFGYDQGFDLYEEMLEDGDLPGLHQPAGRVVDAVLEWLDGRRDPDRPFFLYVHVSDPHAPYVPPAPWRDRFAPGLRGIDPASFGGLEAEELERAVARASDLYDAEVAYVDEQFGRLVDGLQARSLLDAAALVFLSDHGEEFLEHGGWAHGRSLLQELVHVPLVLKLPGDRRAGRRVRARVRQVDLLPTVLSVAGIPAPEGIQGTSLLPLLEGAGASRTVHGHLRVRGRHQDSVVAGRWKLVTSEQPGDRLLLFDLEADPHETRDLDAERPVTVQYLRGLLGSLAERFAAVAVDAEETTLAPEVEERLRALGYIR